jgi:hypothetical protein
MKTLKALEKDIEKPVVKFARTLGLMVTKMRLLGEAGFPDDVIWLPGGVPLLLEFKRPGEKTDPIQDHIIGRLRRLGYRVEVVDNVMKGKEIIKDAIEAITEKR